MTLAKTITREDLSRLDVRSYEGPVHLLETPHQLDQARHALRGEHVVGLDTETRPSFHKGEHHLPSLVQVAVSHAVYLFPLRRVDCAEALTELLENPAISKAGIGLAHDFVKLKQRFPFKEMGVVDLSHVAKAHGVEQPSVRTLTALFLGFRITKGQSTSNWGRAELTPKQILYAATDAWVCREIFLRFDKLGLL